MYTCGMCVRAKLLQWCPTLYDPMNCSPPGSSVHGILQARILEWVAMPFSRGSSCPRIEPRLLHLLHWQAGSLPLAPPGKPSIHIIYTFSSIILLLTFLRSHIKREYLAGSIYMNFVGLSVSAAAAKSLQSCPTLCDPIDSGPPGSPVPGILQARTLEWVAISFSLSVSRVALI